MNRKKIFLSVLLALVVIVIMFLLARFISVEQERKKEADRKDFTVSLKPEKEESETAVFGECFAGTDIPDPEKFYGMDAFVIGGALSKDTVEYGNISYHFFDAKNYGVQDEDGKVITEWPDVDADAMIGRMNEYLTGRGYGRQSAHINEQNGGTEYFYYKDNIEITITKLAKDNFLFEIFVNEPEEKS